LCAVGCTVWAVLSLATCSAAPPDGWIEGEAFHPAGVRSNQVGRADFESLRAKVLAGQLKVQWTPAPAAPGTEVVLYTSAGEPGHWPARDWHREAMSQHPPHFETIVPVEDVDVPVVFFVLARSAAGTNVSPLRLCRPRALGLEAPTRVFWSYLDGFEEGTEGWRVIAGAAESAQRKLDAEARSGRAALSVRLPAGKHSVTVATTRVRGWQAQREGATGVGVWLRTRTGAGRARFTLLAEAFTPHEVLCVAPVEVDLTERWQQALLPFNACPRLPLGAMDLLAVEFIGRGPQEFLVDDLQLLGSWSRRGD
jgi:hypothetical protein